MFIKKSEINKLEDISYSNYINMRTEEENRIIESIYNKSIIKRDVSLDFSIIVTGTCFILITIFLAVFFTWFLPEN